MRYLTVLGFLLALFLTNCKSNNDEEDQGPSSNVEDSTERLDTVLSSKDIVLLDQLKFSKFSISQNSGIDWTGFRMVTSSHDDTLQTSRFQPDSLYYRRYGRLLKYSPDSSMFVDIDSYGIEFQKNKKGQFVPIDIGPDTEVSLVSVESSEKTRLVFLGPGNGVEDAGWMDNNTVMLIGYHEKDTSKLKNAVLWRYHIPTKTFHVYESADTSIPRRLLNWRKEKFSLLQ